MNPVKKGTEIELDGTVYHLVFDFEAIAEAEEITGKSLITGLTTKLVKEPTINFVRAMFYASAKTMQPALTFDTAKKLITRKTIVDIWFKILEAWFNSAPEPEDAEASANPTQGQK
jgi:hypothetical protein